MLFKAAAFVFLEQINCFPVSVFFWSEECKFKSQVPMERDLLILQYAIQEFTNSSSKMSTWILFHLQWSN